MIKYIIVSFLLSCTASATLVAVDKQEIMPENIIVNGGFENGTVNWTASGGSFAVVTSGSNLLQGKVSATWDSSGAAQTLISKNVTIPKGLYGRNGSAQCVFMVPSGTATHTLQVYDGTNILVSSSITSSTAPTKASVNFVYPSSGSVRVRVVSVAANEPSITIDSCYLGEAANLANISQATLYGKVTYAYGVASCGGWTLSSATYSSFPTDSDCPVGATASGQASLPSTAVPGIKFSSLPPGNYRIVAKGRPSDSTTQYFTPFSCAHSGGDTVDSCSWTFYNGTSRIGLHTIHIDAVNGELQGENWGELSGTFEITTAQSNITYEIQGSEQTTGSVNVVLDADQSLEIEVWRFPSQSEIAFTPETSAQSWSGYHDTTCSWARTNTAYGDFTADASCALVERTNQNFGTVSTSGSVLPAIAFTPKRAGRYFVCATALITTGDGSNAGLRLYDGTNAISESQWNPPAAGSGPQTICGIAVASSVSAVTLSLQGRSVTSSTTIEALSGAASSAVEWSVVAIDNSFPAPLLANSVVSPSSGIVKVASAFITNTGTPTVTRQDGTWISSLTDNGAGDTTINIAAGVFSSIPNCTCSVQHSVTRICTIDPTTTPSTTALRVLTASVTPTLSDEEFHVICVGAP